MEDFIKDFREAVESEKLITARLVDSVARSVQLASGVTPEMQDLFGQWVSLIAAQVMREAGDGEIDVPAVADKIGVKETSLVSLLLFMQRSGRLNIRKVTFSAGAGVDEETCGCLKGDKL